MASDEREVYGDNWYTRAIAAKWNAPGVREAILLMLDRHSEDSCEDLEPIEALVFGGRVECPHGCGSLNLPGAPECWGCCEPLTWPATPPAPATEPAACPVCEGLGHIPGAPGPGDDTVLCEDCEGTGRREEGR